MCRPSNDYYWLIVTLDEFELPVYVAETIEELCEYTGVKRDSIRNNVWRDEHEEIRSKYKRVIKEEYENLEEVKL